MVDGIFVAFVGGVILLRIVELFIAKRNARWLIGRGAVEYGRNHYPYIVALHVLFFVSMIGEFLVIQPAGFSGVLLALYVLLLTCRVWVIASLGRHWNTRIYRIPGEALVKRGPYKFVRHPNYIVVAAELAVAPLVFHLYVTAAVFTVLNAMMLAVRIRAENSVLFEQSVVN